MNRRSLQDITLIVLCLAVLTAAPCAARQDANQAGLNPVKSDRINESLKNELWNLHTEYQLKIFDLRMEQGQRIVTAIGSHGYNTSSLDQTLDKILNHRQELSVALQSHRTLFREDSTEDCHVCRKPVEGDIGSHLLPSCFGTPVIICTRSLYRSPLALQSAHPPHQQSPAT